MTASDKSSKARQGFESSEGLRAWTLTPDLGHVESSSCWRKRDDQDHGQEELLR